MIDNGTDVFVSALQIKLLPSEKRKKNNNNKKKKWKEPMWKGAEVANDTVYDTNKCEFMWFLCVFVGSWIENEARSKKHHGKSVHTVNVMFYIWLFERKGIEKSTETTTEIINKPGNKEWT